MLKKDNKKAHISDTLAGDEIQALQSASTNIVLVVSLYVSKIQNVLFYPYVDLP